MQQALVDPTPQVDSDGPHVADDLVRGLLKGEEDASLPASAGGVDEMSSQACFPGAGRSGHQNAAAAKVAFAAEHRVQGGDARRNPFVGRGMLQIDRRHRQHGNAVALNEEGILVGPVRGAAVLDDAQAPRQHRFGDPVVEQDDAVGNVLFQAVAGQRAFSALAGDDGSELSLLEPAEQAPKFGPQDRFVFESGEQGLDAVEQHPLGADRIHGMTEPDE